MEIGFSAAKEVRLGNGLYYIEYRLLAIFDKSGF